MKNVGSDAWKKACKKSWKNGEEDSSNYAAASKDVECDINKYFKCIIYSKITLIQSPFKRLHLIKKKKISPFSLCKTWESLHQLFKDKNTTPKYDHIHLYIHISWVI